MPNPYTGTDNDPISAAQHQFLGKDWEKYFVMLNQATGGRLPRMGAQGPGAPVSLAGPGRTNGVFANGEQIGDAESARSNAINAYLSDLTDQNKLKHQADLDMAAHNRAVDAQSAARQSADRAMAIANDPRTSAFGAPIVSGTVRGQAGLVTGAPEGQPPVNRQAVAAQMAPGVIAPPAPAAPVTFGAPVKAVVNGKSTFVRPGSDGQTYDMGRKPVDPATLAPPEAATATGGLDPDAVEHTATQYRILGPSGIPTRIGEADRDKILNEAAKQAKALGQSPAQAVQKQAAFKADAGALNKMTTMKSSAESFENKAVAQADLVNQLSEKVDRTSFPLINEALISGKKGIGDENAQLYTNALTTFAAEYAKIMEGSTGSAAGSSDSARKAATDLISKGLSKGQIASTIKQMQWEMRQTIQGYDTTIDHITNRMGGEPTAAPGGAAPSAAGALPPLGAGEVYAVDDKGNVHKGKAGTPLPAGWKLQ